MSKPSQSWDENSEAKQIFQNKTVINGSFPDMRLEEIMDYLFEMGKLDGLTMGLCWPKNEQLVSLHFAVPCTYQAAFQLIASAWDLVMMSSISKGVLYVAYMQRKDVTEQLHSSVDQRSSY